MVFRCPPCYIRVRKWIDRIDRSAPDEEPPTVHQTWRQSQIVSSPSSLLRPWQDSPRPNDERHPSYPYIFRPGIFRLSILETRETSIVEGATTRVIGETKKKKSQHHHHRRSCGRTTIRLMSGWAIEQSTTPTLGGITERSMTTIMIPIYHVQQPLTMPFKNSSRRPP